MVPWMPTAHSPASATSGLRLDRATAATDWTRKLTWSEPSVP